MNDPLLDVDIPVKEYDDKCKKLIDDIQNDINSLKDTNWKIGKLYLEDLNNLLLDFSKRMETVRMVRTTKNPKDWIRDNPIFEYQTRYNKLHKLIKQGETGQKSSYDIFFESISANMLIMMFIILCIIWLYVRSDLYSNRDSTPATPKMSNQPVKMT